MRTATEKQTPFKRSTPLQRPFNRDRRTSSPPKNKTKETLDDGLAICLVGFTRTMYDSEYEEELRKQAVMSEVLPDAEMWKKWEKTEAPLRQGRGWYPALDRHFLELLVISEIHCLAHPLHGLQASPGEADRIHRHASRVRRVACERIGAERLHAYCERVKEAYEAYVHGVWGRPQHTISSAEDGPETDEGDDVEGEGDEVEVDLSGEGQRGRSKERGDGSVAREVKPEKANFLTQRLREEHDPFADTDAVMTDDGEGEEDGDEDDLGFVGEAESLRIDLDDVQEGDETTSSNEDKDVSDRPAGRESMDVDLIPVQVIHLPDPKPDEERPIKAADVPTPADELKEEALDVRIVTSA